MSRVAAPPDVRESVLDAAMRLMEGHGYKKMTMEAIAHEAGIGKATIYGYFDNKEDVALSVIQRYQETVKAHWREITAENGSPDWRLRRMLVTLVLSGFDKAQRYRQSMDDTLASLRHVILRRRFQYHGELAELLAVVLRHGCDEGLFLCPNVQVSAQALITCVSGLNPSNLSPQELGERKEIEDRTHQIVDLMLTGLLRRGIAGRERLKTDHVERQG
jgi:AcrR family transcriptional regulator